MKIGGAVCPSRDIAAHVRFPGGASRTDGIIVAVGQRSRRFKERFRVQFVTWADCLAVDQVTDALWQGACPLGPCTKSYGWACSVAASSQTCEAYPAQSSSAGCHGPRARGICRRSVWCVESTGIRIAAGCLLAGRTPCASLPTYKTRFGRSWKGRATSAELRASLDAHAQSLLGEEDDEAWTLANRIWTLFAEESRGHRSEEDVRAALRQDVLPGLDHARTDPRREPTESPRAW